MKPLTYILIVAVVGLAIGLNSRANDLGGWERVFDEAERMYIANELEEIDCNSGAGAAVGIALKNMFGGEETVFSVSDIETISSNTANMPLYVCRAKALTTSAVRDISYKTVVFADEIYWTYSTDASLP